jgi:hypothetical protein
MGEWSPENQGGRWVKGATGPAVGATFSGKNKSGVRRWSTTVKVVDCVPGQSFEIAISYMGLSIASWRYDIEAAGDGCVVTESWQDHRTSWMMVPSKLMGDHSGEHAKLEMEATLANVAKAAEAAK